MVMLIAPMSVAHLGGSSRRDRFGREAGRSVGANEARSRAMTTDKRIKSLSMNKPGPDMQGFEVGGLGV